MSRKKYRSSPIKRFFRGSRGRTRKQWAIVFLASVIAGTIVILVNFSLERWDTAIEAKTQFEELEEMRSEVETQIKENKKKKAEDAREDRR